MKFTRSLYILLFACFALTFQSCADDVLGSMDTVPSAFGKVNEVKILADQELWEGPVGDSLDFYYTGAYPITPTPEPMLDLKHFNMRQINGRQVFKHYRTYIVLADLSNKESEITKMVIQDIGQEKYRKALKDPSFNSIVGKNKWAKGQILVYLFAPSQSQLIDALKSKYPDIVQRIYSHDYNQIMANTFAGKENVRSQNAVREVTNLQSRVPLEFQVAKNSVQDKLVWLRKDDDKSIQNVIVQSIPYEDDNQFSQENIISLMEDFGAKHIDDNILLINDRDLPTYEYIKSSEDRYVKELRGIWELEKNFMGGPYIAYLIKEPNSDNLIFTFSFVYAAGTEKRNILQRMEVIMNEFTNIPDN